MVSSQIVCRTESNKQLCDAVNCEAEAIEQIQVSAGTYGVIELNVCSNCRTKFVEEAQT